jgi:hypothetical protein
MSWKDTIVLGVATGLAASWAWPLLSEIGSSDHQRLCSWVSNHLDCRTWRGPAYGMGRR